MPAFRFVQLFPDAPLPVRGDRSLFGTSPLRGFQFCEPFCAANELGWYAFPPLDFALKWDGTNTSLLMESSNAWTPLRSVVLPSFADRWTATCHSNGDLGPPPFLSALPEPGLVQIWSGLVGRSPPGWVLLIRPPPNFPRSLGFEVLEGIIETDWWFGPLITTIRLCRTDEPIIFRRRVPVMSICPLPKAVLASDFYGDVHIDTGMESFCESDWSDLRNAIALHGKNGRPGGYKAGVHARRKHDKRDCG